MMATITMTTKKSRDDLQKELQEIKSSLKQLRKDFQVIKKRTMIVTEKVYTRSDEKEVQKIQQKLKSKT
jgi:hypothetical protein